MRYFFSLIIGLPLFYFFVLNPIKVNYILSLASSSPIDKISKMNLLYQAHNIDPYNNKVLNLAGDIAMSDKRFQPALWCYATAIKNSPKDTLLRAKYAVALTQLGFNGSFALKEAIELEPNNPVFKEQLEIYNKTIPINF